MDVPAYESNIGVLLSEALLALYPQLIKQNELVELQLQVILRVLVIFALSYIYILYERRRGPKDQPHRPLGISMKYGAINSLHIASSYYAFQKMDSSDALAIFYTYPIWNMLLSHVMLGDKIDRSRLSAVVAAFIGVLCILQPNVYSMKTYSGGALAAFIAALTESLLFVSFHDSENPQRPSERMFEQYAGTLVYVCCSLVFMHKFFSHKIEGNTSLQKELVKKIILFNVVIGFSMHLTRAWAARFSRPETFSVLSMTGVLFGFLYQLVFEGKPPTKLKIFGGLLIMVGGAVGTYLSRDDVEQVIVDVDHNLRIPNSSSASSSEVGIER
jgi:drug/metabolite transporter (DMT)-like permease